MFQFSNYNKILPITQSSIVCLKPSEVRVKLTRNISTMRQSDPAFPVELSKMSEILQISPEADDSTKLKQALVLLICYFSLGQVIENPQLRRDWLRRGIKEMEKCVNMKYADCADLKRNYAQMLTMSNKIEMTLVLTKYGLINANIRNWIEKVCQGKRIVQTGA